MITGKRLYIETWGCQMNRHQSEEIAGILQQAGYELVGLLTDADVVLFNGCMVRQKAEEKVYGRIGAVVEEKRQREILLGVGGCLGQIRGRGLLDRFPAVDLVFGSRDHGRLPELIERALEGRAPAMSALEEGPAVQAPLVRSSSVTAMITITEGCSNFCSYCIVPFARGPMRSRGPDAVRREVREAVSNGYREVLLLGQNVNSYGLDRPEFGDFVTLLSDVAAVGPDRIRFTSSHPRDLTADVLEAMAGITNVSPHLHVACQSGSDRILRAMNRGYTQADFLSIVREARSIVPGINLTTDLIVGYPGETGADFAESLEVVERARFGSIFVAKYSPRPGTKSAEIDDDVPEMEKRRRLHAVLDRQREIALEENEGFIGREVEVLIEAETRDGAWYGRASDHRTVLVGSAAKRLAPGDLAAVRIETASAASLGGVLLVPAVSAKGRP